MERKNKIPNTRLSLFYDEEDFNMELDAAKELIENDMNFTVILYRIDRNNSTMDDIYQESRPEEIRYLPPVELKVILDLKPSENKSYGTTNSSLRYREYGNLIFKVLTSYLEEKNIDIIYGDIVGFSDREDNLKYFEVYNDGRLVSDNQHTHFGYRGYFRTVECVVVDPNQFNGI